MSEPIKFYVSCERTRIGGRLQYHFWIGREPPKWDSKNRKFLADDTCRYCDTSHTYSPDLFEFICNDLQEGQIYQLFVQSTSLVEPRRFVRPGDAKFDEHGAEIRAV